MEETKTYEFGFLLTPLLTEESVAGFLTGALKQLFDKHQMLVTATVAPKMIPLAYTIRKRIENKNQIFREAYFGAIRFTAAPEAIPAFNTDLRKVNEVIRSLVIIIPKGADEVVIRREPTVRPATLPAIEAPLVVVAEAGNKAEVIDKEIDELLASTTS